MVILNHADLEIAREVAERITSVIRSLHIVHRESPLGLLTISGGIVEFGTEYDSPEEMVKVADDRLYRAKNGGRNRIVS